MVLSRSEEDGDLSGSKEEGDLSGSEEEEERGREGKGGCQESSN